MKNFKIGFSMLVAILVLSIGAIASAATIPAKTTGIGVKAKDATHVVVAANVAGSIYSGGSGVLDAETGWVITLKKASDNSTVGTQDSTLNYATFTVAEGVDYYAVVVAKNATGSANAFTSVPFTFDYNALILNTEHNGTYLDPATGKIVAGYVKDNNVPNVNNTGVNGMAKGISGHKTHGDYKNNTNSCASCHQTHTAAGKNLLFKETAEEACLACHDGTGMTIYNVFPTSMANDNGSGTFAGTAAGNMSVHLTNESVELSAAPGSNLSIKGATWTGEFSCDTCHNPHGSYSSRLLATNTAGFMNVPRTYVADSSGTVKQWYGGLFATVTVTDATAETWTIEATDNSLLATKSWDAAKKSWKYTAYSSASLGTPALAAGQELKLAKYKVTANDIAPTGYYYKTGLQANDVIYQFVKKADGAAVWQRIPFNTVANNTPDFGGATGITKLNNVKGYFVTATQPATITNFRAFQIVKLPQVATANTPVNGVQEMKTPWNDAVKQPMIDAGTVAYAQFCGTCHVDYASASGIATDIDNGTKAYHHTANSTSAGRSCAFCHYAHGTDVTFMKDAVGNTVDSLTTIGDVSVPTVDRVVLDATAAKTYLLDKNPSSALKRYTNMSVCYGCHVSSHYAGLGNNGQTGAGSSTGLGGTGLPNGVWQ